MGRRVRSVFDETYYDRYYRDPDKRATNQEAVDGLVRHVLAYMAYLELRVSSVLDVGCGLGMWKDALSRLLPCARYTGLESSDYLCRTHGWVRGTAQDLDEDTPYDLVVCQSVLQYLSDEQAEEAIRRMGAVCSGAMYLEVVTQEDWDHNCERSSTDGAIHRRPTGWYRNRLVGNFVNAGGGLFVAKESGAVLYELEKAAYYGSPATVPQSARGSETVPGSATKSRQKET